MSKYIHGFTVIAAQPYHIGHDRLVKAMLNDCDYVTVVIGSAQESGTRDNPLPYHIRKKMIQNVYRGTPDYDRLWIVGMNDTSNPLDWPAGVLKKIKQERTNIPMVDVFYGGLKRDYEWFKLYVPQFELCDRTTQDFPFLSGGMLRDMISCADERWRGFVHQENYEIIEKNFTL